MKVNAVNVIEYANDSILSARSFSEDAEGNKEAENLFKAILKEQDCTEEEIEFALKEKYHEQGDYQLFLIHS